jgi:Rieske Fe-S protein
MTAGTIGDFGGTVPAGFSHGFRDPCHGGLFSLDGQHLDGPGERGLYRFPVAYLLDGSVVVDLTRMSVAPLTAAARARRFCLPQPAADPS